jgi:hypothetical protein
MYREICKIKPEGKITTVTLGQNQEDHPVRSSLDFYSTQLQNSVFTKLDVSLFRESCQDSAGKTTVNEKEHKRRGTKPQH